MKGLFWKDTGKKMRKFLYQSSGHNVVKEMDEHATARTCQDCLIDMNVGAGPLSASHWRFGLDQRGGIDKSSRVAVCERHAGV